MKIFVKHNDVMKAYKVLTKKLNDEGVFKAARAKEYYLSPSQRVKAKKKLALSRWRKDQKKKTIAAQRQEEKHLRFSKKAGLPHQSY